MKKIIFLLLLIPIIGIAQEGGYRSLKTKSAKIIFTDLLGSGNKIVGIDNNGLSKAISIDNTTITLVNDTLRAFVSTVSTTQTLSGTTPTWDASLGDAKITLTGNTSILITNASDCMSRTITVYNAATPYTLSFSGYTNYIKDEVKLSVNTVVTSGLSRTDSFTFKYNGTEMTWNGGLYYH